MSFLRANAAPTSRPCPHSGRRQQSAATIRPSRSGFVHRANPARASPYLRSRYVRPIASGNIGKLNGLLGESDGQRVKVGVIGGSNLTDSKLFDHLTKKLIETKYGDVTVYDSEEGAEQQIAFVRRHYTSKDERLVEPNDPPALLYQSTGGLRSVPGFFVRAVCFV